MKIKIKHGDTELVYEQDGRDDVIQAAISPYTDKDVNKVLLNTIREMCKEVKSLNQSQYE